MKSIKHLLLKLNPCVKSKSQVDAEYFAMRRNEPIPKTICEKVKEYASKEYKWLIGLAIACI